MANSDDDDGRRQAPIPAGAQYYASEMTVNVSVADATLSFGRAVTLFSPEGEVLEEVRGKEWLVSISVSPPSLKSMAAALQLAVQHYEKTHGAIVSQTPKTSVSEATTTKRPARK